MIARELKKITMVLLALYLSLPAAAICREKPLEDDGKHDVSHATSPATLCPGTHNVGKIALSVHNNGTFGFSEYSSQSDCFTGERAPYCEYPKESGTQYLYAGAFWIGAVVGRDTLVSTCSDGWQHITETYPYESPWGDMVHRSIIDPAKPEFEGAVSEQDYVAVYTDTFTTGVVGLGQDPVDNRPHQPLFIEITQKSYAWSYPYAEDFVLFDYSIKNIGQELLTKVYMGIYVDADVQDADSDDGHLDDLCGFLNTYENPYGDCYFEDTVFIAWIADNDGDFEGGGLNSTPVPHVTATRIVRTPADELEVSFNWWISNNTPSLDFGPRKKSENFRDLGFGQLGTPEGDRNKYDFLRNREFDYDQIYTASISPSDPVWLYPDQTLAETFSKGYDTRYLLSFGPFNIEPGQSLPLSFAYVAGEYLHNPNNPDNANDNLINQYHPDIYYDNLNFDDLSLNSMWASWVYDNPGVDSDNDDKFGKAHICCKDSAAVYDTIDIGPPLVVETSYVYDRCDTFWYVGDGRPDFRGASPPPSPASWGSVRIYPSVGQLTIRWNGLRSENTRDVFSREFDFEGYRVYLARDERESSYVLLASYDIEDYNRLEYNVTNAEWELNETPFTLEELRCLYGDDADGNPCDDSLFDPSLYSRNSPLILQDESGHTLVYAFEPQDFNRSVLGNYPDNNTPIRKTYPDQPYPSSLEPDEAEPSELTEDGYLKYFEYEYTAYNLLPTVPYYVNVTAFDYGSPQSGLASLETSKTLLSREAYPLTNTTEIAVNDLKVYVYPNPYRINGNYINDGYEGRNAEFYIPDRMRRLHFANLPPKCTIAIYTLDGDLIREFEHDKDADDPTAMHDEWDMISRNTQRVVTGIYYWVVKDDSGDTQIGKFVIIM